MDEYLKLLNLVNYYLSADDIVDNDKFISVSSLVQIVNEELARLSEITVNKTLKNKIKYFIYFLLILAENFINTINVGR